MLSRPGNPIDQHYLHSLRPFFARHRERLEALLPEGLVVVDGGEEMGTVGPLDLFLCFEPSAEQRQLVTESLERNVPARSALVFYENPAAYHYRKGGLESPFSAHFQLIFSSVALLTDIERHFWTPAWSFVHDFETGEPAIPFKSSSTALPGTVAINPLNTGIQVSNERIAIIDYFVRAIACDVFGLARLFEEPPCLAWKHRYVGEIPFSPRPYGFLEKVGVYSNYRFVVVPENTFADGYLTEKLGEPLAALAVPIYFGTPHIDRLLPNLFAGGAINGHAFHRLADLTAYISQMSDSDHRARIEVIKQNREEYFDLTKRTNIWEFVLAKLFDIDDIYKSSAIYRRNEHFARLNLAEERQVRKQKFIELLESGLDGWEYNRDVQALLFEPLALTTFI